METQTVHKIFRCGMTSLVLVAFMATISVASVDSRTYIVHMDESKMKASYPSAANSKGMFEEMVDSISQLSTDSEATPPPRLLYAYDTAIFGFAAKLSPMHLESIRNMDAFVAAIPDRSMRLHTTHSYQFLGLEQGRGLWQASNLESDVIIGVIDTGIWPEHPSFQGQGFGPVPARWKGTCESGTNFSSLNCNRKLIGARYFFKGYEAALGRSVNKTTNFKSPRDRNGHGTHCASTVGGNLVHNASFYGLANGVAAGMRYTSRIAVYKVCWEAPAGCISSDTMAAIDQAIKDGVDVVSISIGNAEGGAVPYFDDLTAQAAFTGIRRGIFFSCAAGNSGPRTVDNTAPWLMTVAASYTDRSFPAIVRLGNGKIFEGISLYSGKSLKELPIVYGPTAGKKFAQYCIPGTLNPTLVRGKVVVCEQGRVSFLQMTEQVKSKGGAGTIILLSEGKDLFAIPYMSPAASVGHMAGKAILRYLNSTKSPTASLTFKGTAYGKRAPMMAAFSSRGPNRAGLDLLKPDLTAPGVNILAAWPGISSPTMGKSDKRRVLFNMVSGTSMACPHVSGLATLLISRHKEWSPAAIKSAMMTTAYNLDNRGSPIKDVYHGGPATPFAIGSGHVDIQRASDPGLLYDIHPLEYLHYLCSLKYTSLQIAKFDQNFKCPKRATMQPGDLNYPSFAVLFKSDAHNVTITYRRTVTNVGNPPIGTYKVLVQEPKGISVRVKPSILSFKTHGQKLGFKVSFTAIRRIIESENSCFGSLTWVSGKYMVRSPIAATWI